MDKNAIKKYAVWARRELIERVSQRAMIYGITAKDAGDLNAESVLGHLLSQAEKRQRQALIRNIKAKGYEQVMEEVAYTWFNRFAALRFMEINGYLPYHIRVFTNDAGEFKPQILAEAIHLELDGLDMNKVYELESANKSEELFKYLLIVQCNALNSILPGMFQKIEDYTELLLPDYLLREGSVIEQMVTTIPEEDWTDQVQIIGWLYQYYNTEPKDKVFADLKKNIKITKENIPAATQLFTPDWIVHYMVENSLGRLWLEGHPNDALKSEWKYYLDEAEQEPEVQTQLDTIRKEYAVLKPEEIRVIDPCMGSGHILCALFDTLVRIYEDYGYTAREAASKIVENNLWGLDIDDRAAQLSYFAVIMKARQYDRRFFTRKVQPHVYAIEESNWISSTPLQDMGLNLTQEEYREAVKQAMQLIEEMHDAKEYGSIIQVTPCDWNLLRRFAVPRNENGQLYLDIHGVIEAATKLQMLIDIGEALAQKYNVIVTNPPYLAKKHMSSKLLSYVTKQYPASRFDLFSVILDSFLNRMKQNAYFGIITQHVMLFSTKFTEIREKLLEKEIINMVHLGTNAFDSGDVGTIVQTATYVVANYHIKKRKGTYIRLVDYKSPYEKRQHFRDPSCMFISDQRIYNEIEDSPVSYWLAEKLIDCFSNERVGKYAEPRQGLSTSDNDRFLRLWYECDQQTMIRNCKSHYESKESLKKWYPYNKGGTFRKWYGNQDYVINWQFDGKELREWADWLNTHGTSMGRLVSQDYYFHSGLSWSAIAGGQISFRFTPQGFLFDSKGPMFFVNDDSWTNYFFGYLNSTVANRFLEVLAPTFDFNQGPIRKLPIRFAGEEMRDRVNQLVGANIQLAKQDWDAFETSWDFQRHPLVFNLQQKNGCQDGQWANDQLSKCSTIAWLYKHWERECDAHFNQLKANEEELNRIFIEIFGLQEELTPAVEEKNITVRKSDLQREIRSLISYAVGCMFGRYSLDVPGLAYAGGTWDSTRYKTFIPDGDAILPICDDEYFKDDIVGRFVQFIEVAYGKETLEENLKFISDALGGKGSPRQVIRNYFMNDFYSDHLKVYQKRPIYWLFDSGKKNGFKCLVYMHRYQPDTIARIRTDYVHEQQSRYRTAIDDLDQRMSISTTSERVKLSKQLSILQSQAEELRTYEERIHHLADQMIKIDLDAGVKHNYEIFGDVLAKIK